MSQCDEALFTFVGSIIISLIFVYRLHKERMIRDARDYDTKVFNGEPGSVKLSELLDHLVSNKK